MTKDDIIRMAREAGLHRQQHNLMSNPVQYRYSYDGYEENLEAFAALVAAAERDYLLSTEIHSCHANCQRFACVQTRRAVEAEREACAKVVDKMADYMEQEMEPSESVVWVRNHAAAIRARGEVK